MATKVTGPESSFPSIEAKYGKTIDEWQSLLRSSGISTHGKLVNWLKKDYGVGHGHATTLVAHFLHHSNPTQ